MPHPVGYCLLMTKKHFEAIAAIIRDSEVSPHLIARDFADYFQSINPNFDRDKFLAACGF